MTAGILNATGRLDAHSAWRSGLSRASAAQPISRTPELEQLAQADWHIAEVKSHIIRQRLRVKYALETGQSPELVDSLLRALEAGLRAFENHREMVLNRLKRRLSD